MTDCKENVRAGRLADWQGKCVPDMAQIDYTDVSYRHPSYFLDFNDYRRFYLCARRYAQRKGVAQWQALLLTDNTTVREEISAKLEAEYASSAVGLAHMDEGSKKNHLQHRECT